MLDIIITHYDEPWEVCRRQFEMLAAQRRVNWNHITVTVVNDGGYQIREKHIADLPFRVRQINIEQGGVSRARNMGFINTWEPWVMFCDCDDCFANIYALEDVMACLTPENAEKYDMLWTKVWQDDDQVSEIQDIKIMVFIHGKVYRRQFLLHEGIRFDEELSFNEDSLFNATIMTRTTNERIGQVTTHSPVYAWLKREGSVTEQYGATDKAAWGQFCRNLKVTQQILEHKPEEYQGMVTRAAYDVFYMQMSSKFSPSCKQKLLEAFRPWIRERIFDFGKVDEQTLRKIRDIDRMELLTKEDIGRFDDSPDNVSWYIHGIAEG